MHHSRMLENLFVPYDYEIIQLFCECSGIYLFVDYLLHGKNISVSLKDGEGYYRFDDPKTFYFHLSEEKLYGGPDYALVVFKHSEEEIINKFDRFMKMRAFL